MILNELAPGAEPLADEIVYSQSRALPLQVKRVGLQILIAWSKKLCRLLGLHLLHVPGQEPLLVVLLPGLSVTLIAPTRKYLTFLPSRSPLLRSPWSVLRGTSSPRPLSCYPSQRWDTRKLFLDGGPRSRPYRRDSPSPCTARFQRCTGSSPTLLSDDLRENLHRPGSFDPNYPLFQSIHSCPVIERPAVRYAQLFSYPLPSRSVDPDNLLLQRHAALHWELGPYLGAHGALEGNEGPAHPSSKLSSLINTAVVPATPLRSGLLNTAQLHMPPAVLTLGNLLLKMNFLLLTTFLCIIRAPGTCPWTSPPGTGRHLVLVAAAVVPVAPLQVGSRQVIRPFPYNDIAKVD